MKSLAALWCTLTVAGSAYAAGSAAPVEQLHELAQKQDEVEFLLRQVETKRATALATLDTVEKEVQSAELDATTAHQNVVEADTVLKAARAKEAALELKREAVTRELAPRLLLRYRLRGSSYLQALLLAPSVSDFLWRRRMVDRILASDLALIDRLVVAQRKATAARAEVESEQAILEKAEQAAQQRAADATRKQQVQTAFVDGLMQQRSTYLRTMEELKKARRELARVIEKLPAPPDGLGGFDQEQGTLTWPANGTISIGFGPQVDPKFGTVVLHNGVDIDAPAGTVVRAPYQGVVAYAGWFSGFGNLIILNHGDGYYTLYAHLKDLKVQKGVRVDQNAELGTVGDTGSLKGPYLYFEIRSGSKALDPEDWLARKDQEDITPAQ